MAATVPPVHEDPGQPDLAADQVDSDLDAEGEEETDLYGMDQQLQDAVHRAFSREVDGDNGDSEADAVTARVKSQQTGGDDETEPVGAVKVPQDESSGDDDDDDDADRESENADGEGDPAFEDENDREASESSDSESEAEDWEAESNGHEDGDAEIRSRTDCM